MAFVDECTVFAQAGRGGNGSAHLHSEPYKPRGGPDGGDGGDGGDIVFEVDRSSHDLSWLADHPHVRSKHGSAGRSSNRHGASAADLVIQVPDGTVVSDDGGLVADLLGMGTRAVVARGGRGGRGNLAFAGPRNRVPRTAEPGEEGEEKTLRVELRTVADVGLVGPPNAGKSTLLTRLTAARPKIGDYPFTTLTPNLGVMDGDPDRYVVADIPGLVRGASLGKGLGDRFLRHIVRCRGLLLVIDLSSEDPAADLDTMRAELAAYDPDLAARASVLVGTKADLVEDPDGLGRGLAADVVVSAVSGEGIEELQRQVARLAREAGVLEPEARPQVILRPGKARFSISRGDDARWRVSGSAVERWVAESDLQDETQTAALAARLKKEGVERKLASMGARHGDEVVIGGHVFEFLPDDQPAEASGRG